MLHAAGDLGSPWKFPSRTSARVKYEKKSHLLLPKLSAGHAEAEEGKEGKCMMDILFGGPAVLNVRTRSFASPDLPGFALIGAYCLSLSFLPD
jgi:hypothetical protein